MNRKRLTPNQLKVMLDLARNTDALKLTEVAGIVLKDAGFTDDEIATLTVSRGPLPVKSIEKKRRAGSVAKRGSAWTKADDKAIVDLWADGYSSSQIARQLRRTTGAVTIRIGQLRKNGEKIAIRNAAAGQRMRAYHNKRRATSKK